MIKIMVFDTETTDLVQNSLLPIKHQPKIVEFYGEIISPTGEVFEELDFLCDPEQKIEPITTKITGLTQQELDGQPPFRERAAEVAGMLERSDWILAHNLSFDLAVLGYEFQRCGRELKLPPVKICTVEQTEWWHGFRLNLSRLHEEILGTTFEGAHRAKVDVKALSRIVVELFRRGELGEKFAA